MAISDNGQGVFIEKVQPAGSPEFDTYIGRRMDLHCTSLGKVTLAHDTSEAVQRVRADGYAIANQEEELRSRAWRCR